MVKPSSETLDLLHATLVENQRQKALLEAIFEADPGAIAVMAGPELRFTFFNPAFRFVIPEPEKSPLNQPFAKVWNGTEAAKFHDDLLMVLETGKPFIRTEFERRIPEVYQRNYTIQARRINWAGEPAVLLILWDTTERKTIESALRESEKRYHNLFQNMTEGFALHEIICDGQGLPIDYRFLDVNPAFEQLTRLTRNEVVGKRKCEIEKLRGDDANWIQIYGKVALTGEPIHFENYSPALNRYYHVFSYRPAPMQFAVIFEDITLSKQTEQALRRSEENYRHLVRYAPTGIYEIDFKTTRFKNVNDAMCEYLGYTREELLAMDPFDLLDEPSKVTFGERIRRTLAGESITDEVDYKVKAKDGREYDAALNVKMIYQDGIPQSAMVIAHDMTDRKRAENLMQQALNQAAESQRMLQALMEYIPEGITIAESPNATIKLVSKYGQDILGGPHDHKTASQVATEWQVFSSDGVTPLPETELPLVKAIQQGEVSKNQELIQVNSEGKRLHLSCNAGPIRGTNGEITGAIVAWRDIGDLKISEQERLAAISRSEVQARILEQREQERIQIARDLHDGPLQDLIATSFLFHDLCAKATDPELVRTYTGMQKNIQNAINELRAFAQDLRPPILATFGFEKAVRAHIAGLKEKYPNLQVQIEVSQKGGLIPEPIRIGLYRVYQEAMNNMLRHSQASHVWVTFMRQRRKITLTIRDDGVGFQLPEDFSSLAQENHLGLVGMRERVEAMGGKLEVESGPGKGTTVRVKIPVRER